MVELRPLLQIKNNPIDFIQQYIIAICSILRSFFSEITNHDVWYSVKSISISIAIAIADVYVIAFDERRTHWVRGISSVEWNWCYFWFWISLENHEEKIVFIPKLLLHILAADSHEEFTLMIFIIINLINLWRPVKIYNWNNRASGRFRTIWRHCASNA